MSEDTEQPGPEPAAGAPEAADHPPRRRQRLGRGSTRRSHGAPRRRRPPRHRSPSPRRSRTRRPIVLPAATPAPAARGHRRPDTPHRSTPTAIPFSYPPPADSTYPGPPLSPRAAAPPGKFRTWFPVVLVAALVGGAIGAGVTAIANHDNNGSGSNVTIHESNAAPGAAVLSGNVTIPQLVSKVIPAVVSIDVKSNGERGRGDRHDHHLRRRGHHQQPRH